MNVNEFMNKIGYSDNAIAVFNEMAVSEEVYLQKKAEYYADEKLFLANLEKQTGDNYYKAILYYFTRMGADLEQKYFEWGFGEKEYIDTFHDLKIWNEMCLLETGICGLKEVFWISNHLHVGLIRLGRLEFQPGVLEDDAPLGDKIVKKGEKVYHIHIPFGSPLTKEEVDNSFALAKKYFGTGTYLHLTSWVLDPTLKKLLKPESNLLAFASRFNLYKTMERYAIERFVFLKVKENKAEYEAKNSFQRALKEALLKGEKFYSGFGITQI